jgi:hypothetical protein
MVSMVWMPSLVARAEVLTWLWRVCQMFSRHMDRMGGNMSLCIKLAFAYYEATTQCPRTDRKPRSAHVTVLSALDSALAATAPPLHRPRPPPPPWGGVCPEGGINSVGLALPLSRRPFQQQCKASCLHHCRGAGEGRGGLSSPAAPDAHPRAPRLSRRPLPRDSKNIKKDTP